MFSTIRFASLVSPLTLALAFVAPGALAQPAPTPRPATAPTGPAATARGVTAPSATPPAPPTPSAPPAPGASANPAAFPVNEVPATRTGELRKRFDTLRSSKGLTPEETARRTVKNSPNLEAKLRAVENVDAQTAQALWGYMPRARLGASYMRLSAVHPDTSGIPPQALGALSSFLNVPVNSTVLEASIAIPLSDYVFKLSHARTGAEVARQAALLDRAAAYASVDRDARVSYYGWVRAQAQEIIADQALEQANAHLKDASNAFQAGLVSKVEVLGAQVAKKNAELLLERAKNNTELARLTLEVGMGDTPGHRYEIGEDVFAPNPGLEQLPEGEAAVREAEAQRMEFKALIAQENVYREQASIARIADYPRLDGLAGITYANPNQRYFPLKQEFNMSWQAGVALTWTPTDIGGAEAGRTAALAKVAELTAQRRALRDGLRLEIDQALKAAREARFTIDVAGNALEASEESYRVRHELFRAGRATIVELTDAETDLTRTRLQLADAHVNGRVALVQLNHALGRDTEAARAAAPSGAAAAAPAAR